ncbi:MAG: SurA N-terminal domain-containing protein [Spirochaetia bacterium]|nr:SurA N-terminal domain-containing protein [Spirochaetia bacterium]
MKKLIITAALMALAMSAFAVSSDRILVKVNNEVILESEVNENVEAAVAASQSAGKPADRKELRAKILDTMIEQRLIITVAKDEQVAVSEEAVADKVNEFVDSVRSRFPDEAAFEEALVNEGVSYTDFRIKIEQQVRDSLIFSKVKQKKQQDFISKAAVGDNEINAYFEKNIADFKVNDVMNISLVYINSSELGQPADKYSSEIASRMKAEGFEKVAAEITGKKGISVAELGDTNTADMDKNVREAIGTPKKGKIAGPIAVSGGYQIIKVIDFKKGDAPKLEDVKEKVRVKVIEQKVDRMWTEWMGKVKEDAFIKYM